MEQVAVPMEFYRYEDVHYTSGVRIHEIILYLVKETPCGYWISPRINYHEARIIFHYERKRWVSKTSRKRYAYPTRKEALAGYIARKHRQIEILTNQLTRAKTALGHALVMEDKQCH